MSKSNSILMGDSLGTVRQILRARTFQQQGEQRTNCTDSFSTRRCFPSANTKLASMLCMQAAEANAEPCSSSESHSSLASQKMRTKIERKTEPLKHTKRCRLLSIATSTSLVVQVE